jgi:hypothetical protein
VKLFVLLPNVLEREHSLSPSDPQPDKSNSAPIYAPLPAALFAAFLHRVCEFQEVSDRAGFEQLPCHAIIFPPPAIRRQVRSCAVFRTGMPSGQTLLSCAPKLAWNGAAAVFRNPAGTLEVRPHCRFPATTAEQSGNHAPEEDDSLC